MSAEYMSAKGKFKKVSYIDFVQSSFPNSWFTSIGDVYSLAGSLELILHPSERRSSLQSLIDPVYPQGNVSP